MQKIIIAAALTLASLAASAAPVEISGYRTWNGNIDGIKTSGATPVKLFGLNGQIMPLTECAKDAPCKVDLPVGKHDLALCTERIETCKNFTVEVKPQGGRIVYTETSSGVLTPVVLNPLTGPSLVAFDAYMANK